MVTLGAISSYAAAEARYNWRVGEFTIGDVIRKARLARRWSQTKLGKEAGRFQFGTATAPIDKSTVSKVEKNPYTSEFGTVWRLIVALRLTFGRVETAVGHPFTDAIRQTGVSGPHTTAKPPPKSAGKRDGLPLAASSVATSVQTDSVQRASAPTGNGSLRARFKREVGAIEQGQAVAPPRPPRVPGKHAASAHGKTAGGRARADKPRR